jgi:hypothetical protein
MNWVHEGGWRHRALLLSSVVALAACHRGHAGDGAPAPSSSVAADQLGPGELVDGPLRAFELKLPLGMEIGEKFVSVVYASGQLDAMRVANYLRAQVKGGTISVGAAATVFDQVTVPANPKRILRLRVDTTAQGHGARLEVRDVTPVTLVPAKDDAERWRRAGLTPTGQLVDPSHLR